MTEGEFLKELERQAAYSFYRRLSDEPLAVSCGDETGSMFYASDPFYKNSILDLDVVSRGKMAGVALARAAIALVYKEGRVGHRVSHGTIRAFEHLQDGSLHLTICMPIRVVADGREA